jgi:hypothetical protein
MKKLLFALMGICALAFTACDSEDDNSNMSNRWSIDEVTQTLYDNDVEGVNVTVRLALTPGKDIALEPVITCSDPELEDVFETDLFVVIPAGQKSVTFKVSANGLDNITKNGTLSLSFKEVDGVKAGKAATINVAPAGGEVEELTAEQEALIQTWKDNGFDATNYLGVHKVSTIITFNDDDKEAYFGGQSSIEYNSFVTLNLSPNATEDDICFIMKGNALGMQNFLYKTLKLNTVEDEDFWMQNVHNTDLLEQVGYNAGSESFNVALEIHFNSDGTINFTEENDDYEEKVAFIYDYSAWNRQQQMETYIIDNGNEGKEEMTMEDAIEWGITLNPASYLGTSDISYDAWVGDETSLYVTPEGSYTDSSVEFVFPFDFSLANGYEKVRVKITIESE